MIPARRFLRALWIWGPLAAYCGLIFYLSGLSQVPWTSSYPDYLEHALEYLGLSVLTARALNGGLRSPLSTRTLSLAFLLCLGYAILDEMHQYFVPNRFADVTDVLSDAAGMGAGLVGLRIGSRLLVRGRRDVKRPDVDAYEAVLYARDGCPPCFALKRLARRSSRRHGVGLRVIEIDSDPQLVARFGDQVPVLLLPGGGRVRGRAGSREVDEAFRRASGRSASWMRRLFGLANGAVRSRPGGNPTA